MTGSKLGLLTNQLKTVKDRIQPQIISLSTFFPTDPAHPGTEQQSGFLAAGSVAVLANYFGAMNLLHKRPTSSNI